MALITGMARMALMDSARKNMIQCCSGLFSSLTATVVLAALLACAALPAATAANPESTWSPAEVARADDDSWSVEELGEGVYLFRWWPGFYVSPFLVGSDEVLVVDPISRAVGPLYRAAVASVTDNPITKIVYSHDHRDHIVGADVLAPEAEIYAHPGTLESLKYRGDADVPHPGTLVNNGDSIAVGGKVVSVHYFGPNHGRSNIALGFNTARGTMLAYVDTLEVGIAPYRTLPDTHVHGYIESLRAAAELNVDWVLGGHSGPGPGIWIENYLNYFLDMKEALASSAAVTPELPAATVEDVIAQGERHTDAIIAGAIERLRPKYGAWQGFEAWAPMNAQTVWMYMTTGN